METLSQQPIAVIGAGSWGTALALLLARNQQSVRLWGHERDNMQLMAQSRENKTYLPGFPIPNNIEVCLELSHAVRDVRDVLLVVPSHAFRQVVEKLKPLMPTGWRLAWGSKGLDPQTGLTLDAVAQAIIGDSVALAVLSGPSFASEVAADQPTAVTLASTHPEFSEDLIARFHNPRFRLYQSTDLVGVELCGVVKNVLAVGAGICDGLEMGANARSALITRGFAELARLLEAVGGQEKTLLSLAGFGDTILTCMTDQSRNRRFGLAIGKGVALELAVEQIGQVVEGYKNAKQLHQLAEQHQVDMPIVSAVYQVLYHQVDPRDAALDLMGRDATGQPG